MVKLTFYTKPGCHLCEQAEQILAEIGREVTLEIEAVNITRASDAVLAAYFDRIPVIARPGRPVELNWPFTLAQARVYLAG